MASSGLPYFSHSSLEPRPISAPKPSPLPVSSASSVTASAEPKLSLMPPVSFSVMTPVSNISMAAPTVAPNEMGSKPCSLQMKLAKVRASRSLTPVAAPSAQAASYSSPPEATWYWGLSTTV